MILQIHNFKFKILQFIPNSERILQHFNLSPVIALLVISSCYCFSNVFYISGYRFAYFFPPSAGG